MPPQKQVALYSVDVDHGYGLGKALLLSRDPTLSSCNPKLVFPSLLSPPPFSKGRWGVCGDIPTLKTVQVSVGALYQVVRSYLLKFPQRPGPTQELFYGVFLPQPKPEILWEF